MSFDLETSFHLLYSNPTNTRRGITMGFVSLLLNP